MQILELGESYTREQVHKMYGNDTIFKKSGGPWGVYGMLRTHNDRLSWIFYITLGHKEGNHQFVEGVSDTGILTWQSQPSLKLDHEDIKDLINFNSDKHQIHLFFRTKKESAKKGSDKSYRYLGTLGYLGHDISTEKPVHFKWQLLDWEKVQNIDFINETFQEYYPSKSNVEKEPQKVGLEKVDSPRDKSNKTKVNYSNNYTGTLNLDPSRAKEVGDKGELLVLEYERSRLKAIGRSDLAKNVEHTSVVKGDGTGFDIQSYSDDGSEIFIEVKTTTQSETSDFFISVNELEFAKANEKKFFIYRVFSLNEQSGSGQFFRVTCTELLNNYDFLPKSFRVKIK